MVAAQQQGLSGEDFADLARQAKEAGPAIRKGMRDAVKRGGQRGVQAAKRSGANYSSRFAGSVGMQMRTTGQRAGVLITQSRKKAPHGRPFENNNRHGYFLRPVFGRPAAVTPFVRQQAHPWFFSPIRSVSEQTAEEIAAAVDEFARDAGFR